MALGALSIFEVNSNGSDTINSGGFDPSQSGMKTDLSATLATSNAPVITSSGYNFVSSDIGSFLYIQSGTNWISGWYKIFSVSSNAATLSVPCATIATPSSGKWAVDYTQQTINRATATVTSATTTVTATTSIFAESMIGNFITDGIIYKEITGYTSPTVITVDSAPTWTTTTIYIGGAFATIQNAFTNMINGNSCYIKATGSYIIASGLTMSTSSSVTTMRVIGYSSTRGDFGKPTIQASAAITMLTANQNAWSFENLIFDGNNTGTNGINSSGICKFNNILVKNLTGIGITASSSNAILCGIEVTGITGSAGINVGVTLILDGAYIHDNTCVGLVTNNVLILTNCIFARNTGASSDGLSITSSATASLVSNCIFDSNGRDGFRTANTSPAIRGCIYKNNIFTSNAGFGINFSGGGFTQFLSEVSNNAYYNNTLGPRNLISPENGSTTLTGNPFTNVSLGDYSLNNIVGAGSSCRAAGYLGLFPGGLSIGYSDIGAVQHLNNTSNSIINGVFTIVI